MLFRSDGTGHIKVNVSSSCVKVDYVKAYLPKDTLDGKHKNREIGFSYTVGSCLVTGIEDFVGSSTNDNVSIFPNPVNKILNLKFKEPTLKFECKIIDQIGNTVLISNQNQINVSNIPEGMYLLKIQTDKWQSTQKIIISK